MAAARSSPSRSMRVPRVTPVHSTQLLTSATSEARKACRNSRSASIGGSCTGGGGRVGFRSGMSWSCSSAAGVYRPCRRANHPRYVGIDARSVRPSHWPSTVITVPSPRVYWNGFSSSNSSSSTCWSLKMAGCGRPGSHDVNGSVSLAQSHFGFAPMPSPLAPMAQHDRPRSGVTVPLVTSAR